MKPGVWITPKEVLDEEDTCEWCKIKCQVIRCSVQEQKLYIKVCPDCIVLGRKISFGAFRINPNHINLIGNERRKREQERTEQSKEATDSN